MGDLFKGVHLLTQDEYKSLADAEALDPDVLYATPENITQQVRDNSEKVAQHTEEIAENRKDIDINTAEILKIKNAGPATDEEMAEIRNTIQELILRNIAQDEMIANKADSSVLVDYVKNTDYASIEKGGIVRPSNTYGTDIVNGRIAVRPATDVMIAEKEKQYHPITPKTLDYAVKVGVTTNTIPLTEEEKANAQKWLGIDSLIVADTSNLLKVSPTNIAESAQDPNIVNITDKDGNDYELGLENDKKYTIEYVVDGITYKQDATVWSEDVPDDVTGEIFTNKYLGADKTTQEPQFLFTHGESTYSLMIIEQAGVGAIAFIGSIDAGGSNSPAIQLISLKETEPEYVTIDTIQTITGPKTFTEHIYIANADGTVDRISHLNNNFIIHSGATNSAVLNIDEGLRKIYAFNNELAFKSDVAEAAGTPVYIGGGLVDRLEFNSNPQNQIDLLRETANDNNTTLTESISTKVSKSGDTMTGELIASSGVKFGNNKIKSENSGNTLRTYHIENNEEYDILNYTHGGMLTVNNAETPLILQGYDDRPTYVSGSGIMSDIALESDITTAIAGLGTVFDLKGNKSTVADLPTTGNSIGDVWYVTSEQVGYIWLNDGTQDRWERFGAPLELSGYATTERVDAIENTVSNNTANITTLTSELNNNANALEFAEDERQKSKNLIELYGVRNPTDTESGAFDLTEAFFEYPFFVENGYLVYDKSDGDPDSIPAQFGLSDRADADYVFRFTGGVNAYKFILKNLKPSSVYTLSFDVTYCSSNCAVFNNVLQRGSQTQHCTRDLRTGANGIAEIGNVFYAGSSQTYSVHFKNVQLEEGSTETEYKEPEGEIVRDLALYHHSFALTVNDNFWQAYGINLLLPFSTQFTVQTFAKWLYDKGYREYNVTEEYGGKCLWLAGAWFGSGAGTGTPIAVYSSDGTTITAYVAANNTFRTYACNRLGGYSVRNVFKDYVFGSERDSL